MRIDYDFAYTHIHCEAKKLHPFYFLNNFAADTLPGGGAHDGQNLIIWRWSLPSPTDPVW